jgi:hypothetical protein
MLTMQEARNRRSVGDPTGRLASCLQKIGIFDFGGFLAPLIARKSDRYFPTYGY